MAQLGRPMLPCLTLGLASACVLSAPWSSLPNTPYASTIMHATVQQMMCCCIAGIRTR